MIATLPIAFALIATIAEIFIERDKININYFRRWLSLFVSLSGIIIFGHELSHLSSDNFIGSEELFQNLKNLNTSGDRISHWSLLFCLNHSIIFFIGSLLAPRVPLVKINMSQIYLLYCGVIGLAITSKMDVFLGIAILSYYVNIQVSKFHLKYFSKDQRQEMLAVSFENFHYITITGLIIALLDHLLLANNDAIFTPMGVIACAVSCMTAFGLFPFHSWVVPFIGTPRSLNFLPLFVIEMGLLMLFKLFAPLIRTHPSLFTLVAILSILGLIHAAFSFFGESKFKRIPALLYLSHISLIVLSINEFGYVGEIASAIDSTNLLIALCGLISVCNLLTARYGIHGILAPTGLGNLFPELGIFFLICSLSLVGFPGTLGFIQEEFILEAGTKTHLSIIFLITFALTINGFSCFRLFARIFSGSHVINYDREMSLISREKFALLIVLAILIINGFFPDTLINILLEH